MQGRPILSFLLFFCLIYGQAQMALPDFGAEEDRPMVTVKRIDSKLNIDGKLDEDVWRYSQPADGFWENLPSDSVQCNWQTETSH